jgi:uncharacterized protein YprB with RNaseH-like and TPR domain
MSSTFTEVFFDVETKKFFDETGTNDPADLGVSIVSAYIRTVDENQNEIEGYITSFWEEDFGKMWPIFESAKRIIGFNTKRFDIPALRPYAPANFAKLPHFDIYEEIKIVNGHASSLDRIAKDTLGTSKNDNPANAIVYWNKGDKESLAKLRKYCEQDVILTKDIYDFVVKNKFVKYTDRWNNPRTVQIDFPYPEPEAISQESLF